MVTSEIRTQKTAWIPQSGAQAVGFNCNVLPVVFLHLSASRTYLFKHHIIFLFELQVFFSCTCALPAAGISAAVRPRSGGDGDDPPTFYSLRIAARGLSFMARSAGKKPAAIPTKMANPIAANESHGGILDKSPSIPTRNCPDKNLLAIKEIP